MALSLAQEHLDTAVTLDSSALEDSERYRSIGHSHELLPSEMEEVDYESLPTERLSAHLLAGAAAGMMEHCAMYPVDCVKVRPPLCSCGCHGDVCITVCRSGHT